MKSKHLKSKYISKLSLGMTLLLVACVHNVAQWGSSNIERAPAKEDLQTQIQFVTGYKEPNSLEFYRIYQNQVLLQKYDLNSPQGYGQLREQIDQLQEYGKQQKNSAADTEQAEQQAMLPLNFSIKGVKLGLKEMKKLSKFLEKTEPQSPEALKARSTLFELAEAVKNNFRNPWKSEYQLFALPFFVAKVLHYNSPQETVTADSKIDPPPSSFWQARDIPSQEMFHGLGRAQQNSIADQICDYEKARQGWGIHAGFRIQCGDQIYKLKFGNETYSGPFNSRIFWSMGFNVPPVDFVAAPKIHYSRDLFTEFNLRKYQDKIVKVGSLTAYRYDQSQYYDPFLHLRAVQLKSGAVISAQEFKNKVLKNPSAPKAELIPGNFIADMEAQVDHLIFEVATISLKGQYSEIGPWDYESLDHPERRELRGLQMLAAWVGNTDVRWENTRLAVENKGADSVLKHYLIDVGTGLGKARGLLSQSGSDVDRMDWEVTMIQKNSTESGEAPEKIVINGLTSLQVNTSFQKMSLNDGQWMIRKMAALSDHQIMQALATSGMSAAEARLGFEKLVSRRNKMIQDFNLTQDLKSALRKVDRKLNFDPNQTPLRLKLSDGREYTFPTHGLKIVKGRIAPL